MDGRNFFLVVVLLGLYSGKNTYVNFDKQFKGEVRYIYASHLTEAFSPQQTALQYFIKFH